MFLSLFTYCTWSLYSRGVSDGAVVERSDTELVGDGRCQPPDCMTPDIRVLDDMMVPNWGTDPLLCLLLRIIADASPPRSLWHPSVLQDETCPASSFLWLTLYVPLQLHLVTMSAVIHHFDQGRIGWHGVPWDRQNGTEKCTQALLIEVKTKSSRKMKTASYFSPIMWRWFQFLPLRWKRSTCTRHCLESHLCHAQSGWPMQMFSEVCTSTGPSHPSRGYYTRLFHWREDSWLSGCRWAAHRSPHIRTQLSAASATRGLLQVN